MVELCSHCGKALTAEAERCPHCDSELAVTLPGKQIPGGDEGKIPLPAPEAGSEPPDASLDAGSQPSLEALFDDFDPMDEFAPPSGAGEPALSDPTLGGFELTPPGPAGDDVLDFIDTGQDEQGEEPPPEMPEVASEVGLIGFEEAAEEAAAGRPAGQAVAGAGETSEASEAPKASEASPARPADWPDYLDPPTAAPPPAAPSPPVPAATPAAALQSARDGAEEEPRSRLGALSKRQLRLLLAGGVVGGLLGIATLLFFGDAPKEPGAPPVRSRAAQAAARAEAPGTRTLDAEAAESADEEADEEAEARAIPDADEAEEEVAAGEREEAAAGEGEAEARPDDEEAPENFFAAAEALEAEEKWEEALAAYLDAAGPEKGAIDEAHLRRSRIYLRLGELPRALLEARRAVNAKETRLETRLHLAALFERTGSLRDALETYEAGVELHPEAPDLLERLARTHLEMGAPWEAIRLLETKVGAEAPDGLRLALGEAYLGAGSWARAARTLRPLEAEPDAAYPIARALLELGKLREALPHLERAAAAEAADPLVHRHLGYVYKELRRRAEAARAFRSYLDAVPEALDRREIEDEIATLAP